MQQVSGITVVNQDDAEDVDIDDTRTETTDPVGDAFRKALDSDEDDYDDEEDEIVWDPRLAHTHTSD